MVARTTDDGGCDKVNKPFSLRQCSSNELGAAERRYHGQLSRRRGRLTEDGAGRIITGETGLAHTRTGESVSVALEVAICARPAAADARRRGAGWLWSQPGGWLDPTREGRQQCNSYPLSMTRAATSSADRQRR